MSVESSRARGKAEDARLLASEAAAEAASGEWRMAPEEAWRMAKWFSVVFALSIAISVGVWRAAEPGFHISLTALPETPTSPRHLLAAASPATRPACASAASARLAVYLAPPAPHPHAVPSLPALFDYAALTAALAASPHATLVDSPDDACLVFPPWDASFPRSDAALAALASWGTDGRDHVVLDTTRTMCDTYAAGNAIRWARGADERCYWYHHDLVIPSSAALAEVARGAPLPLAQRTHLLVVSASDGELDALVHDPPYVVRVPRDASGDAERALYAATRFVVFDFLAPDGPERLFRILAAHAIPVVLQRGYTIPILPLAEAVEWQHAVFFAKASILSKMPEELYSLSDDLYTARAAVIADLLAASFSSHADVADAALRITAKRLHAIARGSTELLNDDLGAARFLAGANLDIAYVAVLRDGVATD